RGFGDLQTPADNLVVGIAHWQGEGIHGDLERRAGRNSCLWKLRHALNPILPDLPALSSTLCLFFTVLAGRCLQEASSLSKGCFPRPRRCALPREPDLIAMKQNLFKPHLVLEGDCCRCLPLVH